MKTLEYYKSLDYDIIVRREELDGERWFVAYCNEFGLNACHGIGDTEEEAIASYKEEKRLFLELLYSNGESIPEPITANSSFSGIFTIRTTPWLHSLLASQASKNKVSVNSYVNQMLAFCVGKDVAYHNFVDFAEKLTLRLTEQYESIKNGLDDIQYTKPEMKTTAEIYKLSA